MSFTTWSEELSVGVKLLDRDHQRILGILDELHDGVSRSRAKEVLGGVLDRLARYAQTCIAHEEKLLAMAGYPMPVEHMQEHTEFARNIIELKTRHRNTPHGALSLETIQFLKSRFLGHIQGLDKNYGPFLNAKGIH